MNTYVKMWLYTPSMHEQATLAGFLTLNRNFISTACALPTCMLQYLPWISWTILNLEVSLLEQHVPSNNILFCMNLQLKFVFFCWILSMQYTFPTVNEDFYIQFKVNIWFLRFLEYCCSWHWTDAASLLLLIWIQEGHTKIKRKHNKRIISSDLALQPSSPPGHQMRWDT